MNYNDVIFVVMSSRRNQKMVWQQQTHINLRNQREVSPAQVRVKGHHLTVSHEVRVLLEQTGDN